MTTKEFNNSIISNCLGEFLDNEGNTGVKGISSSTCNIPRNRFAFHQADKAKVFVEKRQRRGYIQIAFIF